MPITHRNPVTLGADGQLRRLNRSVTKLTKDLQRFGLHLFFFAGNERNHVVHDGKARDASIARSGEGLHGDHTHRLQPEFI